NGAGGASPAPFVPYGPATWSIHGGAANSFGFERHELSNGIAVLGQDRPASQSVALRFRVPAGSINEGDLSAGLSHLTARVMGRGSGGMSFDDINSRTD